MGRQFGCPALHLGAWGPGQQKHAGLLNRGMACAAHRALALRLNSPCPAATPSRAWTWAACCSTSTTSSCSWGWTRSASAPAPTTSRCAWSRPSCTSCARCWCALRGGHVVCCRLAFGSRLHKLCLVHVPGHAVELMAVAELAIGCAHWRVVPWHNQRLCLWCSMPTAAPSSFCNPPTGLQHLPVHRRHPRARCRPAAHHLCLHQVQGSKYHCSSMQGVFMQGFSSSVLQATAQMPAAFALGQCFVCSPAPSRMIEPCFCSSPPSPQSQPADAEPERADRAAGRRGCHERPCGSAGTAGGSDRRAAGAGGAAVGAAGAPPVADTMCVAARTQGSVCLLCCFSHSTRSLPLFHLV